MLTIDGKEVFTTLEELVNPKHTALLLIDLQNDFIIPGGYIDKSGQDLSMVRQILQPVKRVLQAARKYSVLVVHVQMTVYTGSLADSPVSLRWRLRGPSHKGNGSTETLPRACIDGTLGWQIVDELAPLPNEVVVKKHRGSAFIGTNLDMILRSNAIKSVVIVGLVTHGCVLATAIDTPLFDYYPILLRDCVAGYEAELHDATLLIMSRTKDVVESTEVLEIWTSRKTS